MHVEAKIPAGGASVIEEEGNPKQSINLWDKQLSIMRI